MAGVVGAVLGLAQQRLPFRPRQAAIVEIGARPFAAMVEEADVVVGLLERLDLARDEAVELVEIGDQVGRKVEIQGGAPSSAMLVVVARTACGAALACVMGWDEAAYGG